MLYVYPVIYSFSLKIQVSKKNYRVKNVFFIILSICCDMPSEKQICFRFYQRHFEKKIKYAFAF